MRYACFAKQTRPPQAQVTWLYDSIVLIYYGPALLSALSRGATYNLQLEGWARVSKEERKIGDRYTIAVVQGKMGTKMGTKTKNTTFEHVNTYGMEGSSGLTALECRQIKT